MRILVTGAGGFVAGHLIKDLTAQGHKVVAFDQAFSNTPANVIEVHSGDLRDAAIVERVVTNSRADACIHLGAISFVPAGRSNPDKMLSVNILGTINVLEAFRRYARSARILVISTSNVYGPAVETATINESTTLTPTTMYAISKTAADSAALAYAKHYGMHTMTARPNNHTGPGQAPQFVVPSMVRQFKAIAGGAEPVLRVGNIESKRDFTDVRDVVRAYRLLLEKGRDGEAYNITSKRITKISTLIEMFCALTGLKPQIVVDQEKYRPYDCSPILDITKLQKDTGWTPEISLETTLRDMIAEA